MVAIPWPLSSAPGRVPQESAGRLLNCFAEPLGNGSVVWARCPGQTRFATSTQETFCGGLLVTGTLYTAWDGKVATFDSTGANVWWLNRRDFTFPRAAASDRSFHRHSSTPP